MFTVRKFLINLFFVHLTILSSYVNFVFASPCSRIPQGSGAGKSVTSGYFGIRIWPDDTVVYTPGRQYTRNNNNKTINWPSFVSSDHNEILNCPRLRFFYSLFLFFLFVNYDSFH